MGSAWLVVENFIKFALCTPFWGTLPRELVEKLGCLAWGVGEAALALPAPGQSLAVTPHCLAM